jgi:hypothetical protein
MTIEEFKFMYRRPLEEMAIRLRPLNAPGLTGPVTEYEINQIVALLSAHAATDAMYRDEARQRRLEQVAWKKKEAEPEHTAQLNAAREAERNEHIRKVVSLHRTPYRNTRQSRENRKRQIKALGIPI